MCGPLVERSGRRYTTREETLVSDDAPRTRLAPFVIYLIAFNIGWIVWVYGFYPKVRALDDRSFSYALVNVTVRALLWLLPVLVYIRYVDGVDPLEYLKLKRHWKRGIVVGLAFTVVNFIGSWVRFG